MSFLGLHQKHMEVPKLGVQSQLQPPAYTTATAMSDLSCILDLHGNTGFLTHWARPGIKSELSWILVEFLTPWAIMGTPIFIIIIIFFLWPHPWHMEVSGPGIESKPQLWPMLQQGYILNPLGQAEDWTHTVTETMWDP